jgi:acyl dehydratase
MSEMKELYLDDLHVGQRFNSGSYVMEAARIKEFAAEFDPQPFHLEEAAAEASVFKGLAASGWHTAAAAMRLLVTGGLPFASGIVGLGGEIAWPKPTRPGDTLHVESEIVEITPSRSKPLSGHRDRAWHDVQSEPGSRLRTHRKAPRTQAHNPEIIAADW